MVEPLSHYTQSSFYTEFMKSLDWQIIPFENYYLYLKKLPIGNDQILKAPRLPIEVDYKKIDRIAVKHQAYFTKIEPSILIDGKQDTYEKQLLKRGYERDKFSICQSKTIWVDLKLSQDELLKSLRPETRHHLRKAWQQQFIIKIIENDGSAQANETEAEYYQLFELCARERDFYSPYEKQMRDLWHSFVNQSVIILIYEKDNPKPLSAAFILFYKGKAYYKYGASIPYGRNKYASYQLYWEMFNWARNKGLEIFDLEGVYDERYHHTNRYHGFTQFKRGWSHQEITYLGSFSKYYFWPLKMLSKLPFFNF